MYVNRKIGVWHSINIQIPKKYAIPFSKVTKSQEDKIYKYFLSGSFGVYINFNTNIGFENLFFVYQTSNKQFS